MSNLSDAPQPFPGASGAPSEAASPDEDSAWQPPQTPGVEHGSEGGYIPFVPNYEPNTQFFGQASQHGGFVNPTFSLPAAPAFSPYVPQQLAGHVSFQSYQHAQDDALNNGGIHENSTSRPRRAPAGLWTYGQARGAAAKRVNAARSAPPD